MEPTIRIEGGCFCGRIKFCSNTAPSSCSMCHCRMCQRWTGAPAAMTANFNLDDLEWIGDEPETFATSSILDRQFCRDCGTSIGYRYRVGRFSTVQFILIGTLDHPENLETSEVFVPSM